MILFHLRERLFVYLVPRNCVVRASSGFVERKQECLGSSFEMNDFRASLELL